MRPQKYVDEASTILGIDLYLCHDADGDWWLFGKEPYLHAGGWYNWYEDYGCLCIPLDHVNFSEESVCMYKSNTHYSFLQKVADDAQRIMPDVEYVAMDEDGTWFAFDAEPYKSGTKWLGENHAECELIGRYDDIDIDWEKSLIRLE